MLTSLPSMTTSAYQKHQHSLPRFQGSENAESSKGKSNFISPADTIDLTNQVQAAKAAKAQKPPVDLGALPKAEKMNLKKMLNNARIQLQKSLPKSKTQAEKNGHIANYNMSIYHAFYETIAKQAPEAKDAAIGDWNRLFSTMQEIIPDMSKTESFGDMPEETQYKIVSSISQALRSPHVEVQQTAAEIGESFGMTPDMLQRLKG
jgi:hypothetical protein